jgi:hypothetical protein
MNEEADHELPNQTPASTPRWLRERPDFSAIDFPIYAPAGHEVRVGGWGGSGEISQISIADRLVAGQMPSIEVTTERGRGGMVGDETDEELAREALELALTNLDPKTAEGVPEQSQEGMIRWLEEQRRSRKEAAALAEVSGRSMQVDEATEPWTVATSQETWAAVRRHGPVLIKVCARKIPFQEVTVRRVKDPATELSMPDMPEGGTQWSVSGSTD